MKKSLIPKDAKRIPLRPLALGEVHGHAHRLCIDPGSSVALEEAVEMFEMSDEGGVKTFLRVTEEGVSLQHEEHRTHAIPKGDYEVTIQVQETDWGSQRVQD